MPSAAVLAHADPHGLVADHVLRHARLLTQVVNRVVVVSSAPLRPEALDALAAITTVVPAPGAGGIFARWAAGLEHLGDWRALDRLLLVDDGLVGPFRPLGEVLAHGRPGALAGLTATGPHLDHHFLDVGADVLRSDAVHAFWTGVSARGDDDDLLGRNLSRLVVADGWAVDAVFTPQRGDMARARALAGRRALGQVVTTTGAKRAAALQQLRRPPVQLIDPMVACWYRALDGHLPYLRLSVLADDPGRVGRGRMLGRLEAAHPEALAGVRRHLQRVASDSAPTSSTPRGGAR